MFSLSNQKKELLKTKGHLLVLGGPGSGKTTIALIKAKRIIEKGIKEGQKILFLSFARATVKRVEEKAVELKLSPEIQKKIEINTYHGFTWNLLRSYGYLINLKYPFQLLPPPEAASHLAEIKEKEKRQMEKLRLFNKEGILHFDLFAKYSAELLAGSKSLNEMICDVYPEIIFDEFQDTNNDEWQVIQNLGKKSRLIALADPDQRIYEFRGADPARIGEFIKAFRPHQFDFGNENNRSNGTDIVQFGNDLLTGANKKKKYNDVNIVTYQFRKGNNIHSSLKNEVIKSIQRQNKTDKKKWSLAILVPSKNLMLDVSLYLSSKQKFINGKSLPTIGHEVALEAAALSLSGIVISGLMEGGEASLEITNRFISTLCDYIRGRKGDTIATQSDIKLSNSLNNYLKTGKIRGRNQISLLNEIKKISEDCSKVEFTGESIQDWILIRSFLSNSNNEIIKRIGTDAKYLRLLNRGSILRSGLDELWREKGSYVGAKNLVRNALLQEHFSSSTRTWTGIHIMTMHKAKGKEFNEVIIYEGFYGGKILRKEATQKEKDQSRLNLRVAVTRAMEKTTILTPDKDICPFL